MTSEQAFSEVLQNEHGKSMNINIPASMTFSWILRDLIGSLIQNDTKFSAKWKHRIQLMADEIINNAIEHWSAAWEVVKIKIILYNNSDIELLVEDSWTGKNKFKAEDLLERAKEYKELMTKDPLSNKTIRWRWLAMIVLNWSDSFTYINNDKGWLTANMLKKFTPDCEDPKKDEKESFLKNEINVEAMVF